MDYCVDNGDYFTHELGNPILKGIVVATNDINLIRAIPDSSIRVLSLDEEGTLDPNLPNVIIATCLLPPMSAIMAESDGDEDLYDMYYANHLNDPYIQQFMAAVFGWLFRGGSFMIYAPQMDETVHITKLRYFLWILYGIGFGIKDIPYESDSRCIPLWLNLMYHNSIITPYEYIQYFPKNAEIDDISIQKLVVELNPYANTLEEAIHIIRNLHKRGKENQQPKAVGIHKIEHTQV